MKRADDITFTHPTLYMYDVFIYIQYVCIIYMYDVHPVRHHDPFQHREILPAFFSISPTWGPGWFSEATHREPGGLCSAASKFRSFLVFWSQEMGC